MKPPNFQYKRPFSIDEALAIIDNCKDLDVRIIAGGQSLIPMMNFRVAVPEVLVDLGAIQGLTTIQKDSDFLYIGAMATATSVMQSDLILRNAPLIPLAYEHVAHPTIRNRGTLGGNLCHCDPASEMPMVMSVLQAKLIVASTRGVRCISAKDFFKDLYTTALEPDEILTQIRVPFASHSTRFAFEEISLRKGDYAIVGIAGSIETKQGSCKNLRIGLCGVSNVVACFDQFSDLTQGCRVENIPTEKIIERVRSQINFESTASVSAAYRKYATEGLIRRVVDRLRG